ncbi:MAG: pilus assembly FimT family protein [Phycisphaeraceae bacterium]
MTPRTLTRPRSTRAFTLIEVLVVVAIVGIAGAIVVPHMLASGTLGIQAAARTIIADTLYAQNDAVADQRPRRIVFHPDTDSYELTDANGNRLDVQWRTGGGEDYAVSFQQDGRFRGVEIVSADFDGESYVEFDELGAPNAGGSVLIAFQDTRYRVSVAPFTGRVTVEVVE